MPGLRAGIGLLAVGVAVACAPTHDSGAALQSGAVVRFGIDGADNRGAAVAATGSLVAVAWAATDEHLTNIYAVISRDGGSTFGAPVRVNDIEGDARVNGEQPPRVAIGRDIVVVWESKTNDRSRIRLTQSVDGGRSFLPARTIHEEGLTGARGWASLTIDAQGGTHIAWLDGRNAHRPTTTASHDASAHAQHESMRQDVYQAVFRPDSTSAETEVTTNVCFCCKTGVATGLDGAVYVAWRHIYPTNLRDMAVARSADGGVTFRPPVRVSEDHWELNGCPEDGPSIAVDAKNGVHITWPTLLQGETSHKAIFYSLSRDDGRSFMPRMRIDEGGNGHVAAHPQITITRTGASVVWDESVAGQRQIWLREVASDRPAPELRPPMLITDEPGATYPVIAATDSGVLIAWSANRPSGSQIHLTRLMR